jgi:hypothetical protein
MTEELPATGLTHEDHVSADIAPVYFTGLLDIDHTTPSIRPMITGFCWIHTMKG